MKAGYFAIIVLHMCSCINIMWLFLTVPWVGLRCVILVFPDHTHLLFSNVKIQYIIAMINYATEHDFTSMYINIRQSDITIELAIFFI